MAERLRHMLMKEFLQLFRDPKMRRMVFLVPMVQVLVFGYAVSTDVRNVPTAVLDFDRSVSSRELLSGFSASGYFRFVAQTRDAGTRIAASTRATSSRNGSPSSVTPFRRGDSNSIPMTEPSAA